MNEERILAIDYGTKRIGLAITDPLKIFAYPLITLPNDSKFIMQLKKIIAEYHVVKIILGYPLKWCRIDKFFISIKIPNRIRK